MYEKTITVKNKMMDQYLGGEKMEILRRVALALLIIGGINWGLIGFFQFDLVASIFGGQEALLSRIVYALVGLSALYCLTLLFEPLHDEGTASVNNINYGTEFGEETNDFTDPNKDDDFKL